MNQQRYVSYKSQGFSTVELIIAISITSIVIAASYTIFNSQHKLFMLHEEAVVMQQNLRAGIYHLEREIRMAGCDPSGDANAGIMTAHDSLMRFTHDILGVSLEKEYSDNIINDQNFPDNLAEDILYRLFDIDNDGDKDLVRNKTLVAENIDALDFVYLDSTGSDLDTDSDGEIPESSIPFIRTVQISLVARTGKADARYVNNSVYRNKQGDIILEAQEDHFRRRCLTTEVRCRNFIFH
ncbi:MAG: hypothetical protein ACMUJM_19665 [bacterium]